MSALRVAACVGVLVAGLMLGYSTAGRALADPGGSGYRLSDEQSSKGVNSEHAGLNHVIHRILGEHRRWAHKEAQSAPRAKIGSEPDSGREADPDVTQVGNEGTDPGGGTTDGTGGAEALTNAEVEGGSDYTDDTVTENTAVVAEDPTPVKQQADVIEYPFLYYLLEVRRGGSGWWNATVTVSRRKEVISQPTPEPVPGPAFRGPAPEAPAPEPVLDASGGVAGDGSDYQATGFGGAPVLSAPIVAVPMPPQAAARFPAFPAAATPAPGVGSAAARAASGSAAEGGRTVGTQEQAPAGTINAMSRQTPRQGYTDYLRSPGLPRLAGAALPGVAGILLMTLGGGVIGYRQANAGRMIRASGAARYLP